MRPVTIIVGSFLFWIAAKGRYPKYASLVKKSSDASGPPSPSGAAATTSTDEVVAASIHDVAQRVWDSFKT